MPEVDSLDVPAKDLTGEDLELAEGVRHLTVVEALSIEHAQAMRAFAVVGLLQEVAVFCLQTGTTVADAKDMTVGELSAVMENVKRGARGA